MLQGNLEGSPGFCLVLADAVDEMLLDPEIQQWIKQIRIWMYVDDMIIQAPPEAMPSVVATAKNALWPTGTYR